MSAKDWPKRPEKLEAGSWWVSVVRVEHGSGVPADQLAWCSEFVYRRGQGTHSLVAREAALVWFDETDQSGRSVVTLRVEDAAGRVEGVTVEVKPVVKATVTNAVLWQTETPGVPSREGEVGGSDF